MSGNSLTTDAVLQCPHGGSVKIISANTRTKAGASLALSTDQFVVSGCPFQIPATPPVPSPCVTVQWTVSDMQVKVNSTPTLSKSSVGICQSAAQVPQGSVVIVNTQLRVQSK
jgi:hypothetical protein